MVYTLNKSVPAMVRYVYGRNTKAHENLLVKRQQTLLNI